MSYSSGTCSFKYVTATYIDVIYDTFRTHFEYILHKKTESLDTIGQWRDGLVHQINAHAKQQEDLVERIFNNRHVDLNSQREQSIQAYRNYATLRSDREMAPLLDQCNALKVELVSLNFTSHDTEFIEITSFDEPKKSRESDINADKNEESTSGKKTAMDGTSEPTNNQHTPSGVTPQASSPTTNPSE